MQKPSRSKASGFFAAATLAIALLICLVSLANAADVCSEDQFAVPSSSSSSSASNSGSAAPGNPPSGSGNSSMPSAPPGSNSTNSLTPPTGFNSSAAPLTGSNSSAAPLTGSNSSAAVPSSGSSSSYAGSSANATYFVASGTVSRSGLSYTSTRNDTPAVGVSGNASLSLNKCTVSTSGYTSSGDGSSFYGLNAGILVEPSGTLTMTGGSVLTTGTGANGVFAYGTGATAILNAVSINCTGNLAHGPMAAGGGVLILNNLSVTTYGTNAASVATDRGSGIVNITGGTFVTYGQDSPGLYSTGAFTVIGGTYNAKGAEAAVIEGENSISLTDTSLTATKNWGVLIFQSGSGDAEGALGTFTMSGGSLTVATGPAFYVTNTIGVVTLKRVRLSVASGVLARAVVTSRWGTEGSNGGTVRLALVGQEAPGSLVADTGSGASLSAVLSSGSNLTGNATQSSVKIDSTSSWTVTGSSTLITLDSQGTLILASPSVTLNVSCTASLGGTLQVLVSEATVAGSYTVISAGKINGTFAKVQVTGAAGYTGTLSYGASVVSLALSSSTTTATGATATGQKSGATTIGGRWASSGLVVALLGAMALAV